MQHQAASIAAQSPQLLAATMNTTGEWAHGAPQDLANLQPTSQPCYTVLLLCNAANSMTQRTQIELEAAGHHVVVHEFSSQDAMLQASTDTAPDVILCPFLTKRIPAAIYENPDVPCLVIHPGIAGDRGMSSLDWALQGSASEWGVTILQAAEELDAGDVWATENFAINREFGREPTKSSLYRKECIDAAMACVRKVLHALTHATVPRPLAQLQAEGVTKGDLQPRMKQADRRFSWDMPAHEIAVKVAAGDSQPGVLAPLAAGEYYVFGAVVEGEGSIGVQVSNGAPRSSRSRCLHAASLHGQLHDITVFLSLCCWSRSTRGRPMGGVTCSALCLPMGGTKMALSAAAACYG